MSDKDKGLPDDPFPNEDPNDPFVQMFKELYAKAGPEKRKFLLSINARTPIKTSRVRAWIHQLVKLGKLIDEKRERTDDTVIELFWIRLYGVLVELPRIFETTTKHAGDAPKNMTVQGAAAMHRFALEMRSEFDEDEIILLDWMRQMASHVEQRGYAHKWDEKAQKVDGTRAIELLGGKVITLDEIFERTNRALAKHGSNIGFAIAIVARLESLILKLYHAMKMWSHDPKRSRGDRGSRV